MRESPGKREPDFTEIFISVPLEGAASAEGPTRSQSSPWVKIHHLDLGSRAEGQNTHGSHGAISPSYATDSKGI